MITSAGIGSGIDIESIITQLMTFERAPVRALEQKRSQLDVELSAYGSAKSALNELASAARTLGDAGKLGPFQTSSSDESVATATANGSASSESHEIEVTSLASTHRLASQGYDSAEQSVGTDDWVFSSGDNDFTIALSPGANSLRELKDAINDSVDNDSVTASLLNVEGGTRLILTARESGRDAEISVLRQAPDSPLGPPPPSDAGFEQKSPATDAVFKVDGFDVTSAGNTVADVIEGVTLELSGPGRSTVSTSRDTESMRASLDAFVEQYNALRSNLQSAAEDVLNGDRLPRNIEASLRDVFNQPFADGASAGRTATQLGFTFDKTGVLSIDEARLNQSKDAGLEGFIDVFARAETGFAANLLAAVEPYTRAEGRIAGREDGIGRRKDTIDDNIERFDYRLEKTETRLRRQFTAMDLIVSELQTTSSFLAERLTP